MSLCCEVLKKLQARTLVSAESCTGGMIAERLTNVPGSSEVFGYGFVTYWEQAKAKLVGVEPEAIARYNVEILTFEFLLCSYFLRQSTPNVLFISSYLIGFIKLEPILSIITNLMPEPVLFLSPLIAEMISFFECESLIFKLFFSRTLLIFV